MARNDIDDFVVVEKNNEPTPTSDKIGAFFYNVKNTVSEKAEKVASQVVDTTSVVVDNVKGRVAPNSVTRQDSDYWEPFYIIFREGGVHVLTHPLDTKSIVSLPLSSLKKIERVDPLATGRPHSFRIILFINNNMGINDNQEQSVSITTYSFFGMECVSQQHVIGKEISITFCAQSEEEQTSWIRDIDAALDGLSFKEGVKNAGKSAFNLAKAVGISSFVYASVGTTARRAGLRVANKIISP